MMVIYDLAKLQKSCVYVDETTVRRIDKFICLIHFLEQQQKKKFDIAQQPTYAYKKTISRQRHNQI